LVKKHLINLLRNIITIIMNKEIITEISRIHQLMGTSLIMEAAGGFKTIAAEILTYVSKKVGAFSNDVIDLIRKLKNATSEDEITKLISELINTNDELAKIYLPKIMALIPDNEAKQIIKVKDFMRLQLKSGVPPDQISLLAKSWVDKNVITSLDGVIDIYKKELDDYLIFLQKNQSSPPTPDPKKPTVRDIYGKEWDDIEPLTSEEILELEKLYRSKGLLGSFFKKMRIFAKNVNNMIISEVNLLDDTLSKIKTLDSERNPASRVPLLQNIGENIKKLTQTQSDNKKMIDEWLNINVLDYKLKEAIRNTDGYKSAAGIMDNSSLTSWKENYKGLSERRGRLRTQLNSVFNPFSWSGKNLEKYGGAWNKWKKIFSDDEFGELRRWFLTGQTQKWSGMKDYANKFDLPKTLANATKEQLYSYFMLTSVYALADYITDLLGSTLIEYDWFEDNSWVRKQASGYYENVGYYKQDDTVLQGSEIGAKIIWNYMINEINDLTISFPGLSDDMLKYFGWMNAEDPKSKENIEEIIRKFNDTKEKIKNEKEKIEGELEGGGQNPQPSPVQQNFTNDEEGFKKYIKKEFNDNNPVISGTKDSFTYEGVEFKYNNGKFE
jgi:hypothetical protein